MSLRKELGRLGEGDEFLFFSFAVIIQKNITFALEKN